MDQPSILYALARLEMIATRQLEILQDIRDKPLPTATPPPQLPPVTIADAIKIGVAIILVWSAVTGKLEPGALIAILSAK